MFFKRLPAEILIMIIERLQLTDASQLCEALQISEELAFQYHDYAEWRAYIFFDYIIVDFENGKRKISNPNVAKALLNNSSFQVRSNAIDKVRFAILTQDLELVRDTLKDPRVNHHDCMNSIPLRLACEFGQLDVFKLLVDEHRNNTPPSAMLYAIHFTNEKVLKFLLEDCRSDPSFENNLMIRNAASQGKVGILKLLLADPRVDPSDKDNQAIINAASQGNIRVVKLLLADPRVDPSEKDNQAIINAASQGNIRVVKLLLADPRVNPSDQNNQAIIEAAQMGNSDIIKLLLEDPRVDPSDEKAIRGHMEIVKLLLEDERIDQSIRHAFGTLSGV